MNPPPDAWEEAAQAASKLQVVMNNPKLHDPDGSKREKYQELLGRFNVQTGSFEEN